MYVNGYFYPRLLSCLLTTGICMGVEAAEHEHHHSEKEKADPTLPEGMSLDDVLNRAAKPPPANWPPVIHDNAVYGYLLFEQFEYRIPSGDKDPHFGWDAAGWIGTDAHRLAIDFEGEWNPKGSESGEAETELRYSRLVSSFWSLEAGLRYELEWKDGGETEDLLSGVVVLAGLAPYQFEMNTTLAVTEKGDLSLELEIEYDLWITQRLILQPRLETALYASDIEERFLVAGINDFVFDLRLRYEIRRSLAPYIGYRYKQVVGEARNLTTEDDDHMILLGLRWSL